MNLNRRALASGMLALLTLMTAACAQTPSGSLISYQGRLTNANGAVVPDGAYGLSFTLRDGTNQWTVPAPGVPVKDGVFTALLDLGLATPTTPALVFDPSKSWTIQISITGRPSGSEVVLGPLSPAQPITSVPMAQVAASLQPGVNITAGEGVFSGKGTFGGGVGVDMRETPDSIAINGAGSRTGVAGFSPSGAGVEGYSPQGDAISAWSTSGNLFKGSSVGTNQAVAWIDRNGKGIFNGGVACDTRSLSGSDAIMGYGQASGVYGYSPTQAGLFGLTDTGDAIYVRVLGEGTLFRGALSNGNTVARIDAMGRGYFEGGTQNSGADYADLVTVQGKAADYAPGDVLVIGADPARPFTKTAAPYAKNVAGIYSTKPGYIGSKRGIGPATDNEIPLALTGIVPCKVTCQNGPIRMGDLLATSSTPGYAMKATDSRRMAGAVVGKALQPLAKGRGVIEVLVTLR